MSNNSPRKKSGCLSRLLTWLGLFFIVVMVYTWWTDKNEPTTDSTPSIERIDDSAEIDEPKEKENLSDDNTVQQDSHAEKELSAAAHTIEQMYFHGAYTDLGTVEIYHFDERIELLEQMAYLLSEEMEGQAVSVATHHKLLEEDYFYVTDQETNRVYIGEIKNERPHGFGVLLGTASQDGTYEFSDVPAIYYAGEFKDGMFDGYGAVFSVNGADITQAVQNVAETGLLDEAHGEVLVNYLFNYVYHEGYFEKNHANGRGNQFTFPTYEGAIYFLESLNPPLDGYIWANAYPNVTMGEYNKDTLNGKAVIYEYNRLRYEGEMKNGEYNGEGTLYDATGAVEFSGRWTRGNKQT